MKIKHIVLIFLLSLLSWQSSNAQQSVAREWNELLLESIREDLARPTVHARNLFHTSVAMYDLWAVYDSIATPFFLGQTVDGFNFPFNGMPPSTDIEADREEAISYAMYRLLRNRFGSSNASSTMFPIYDNYMASLGYSTTFTSTNYTTGSAAALGNYLAQYIITFGYQDGSNQAGNYANTSYSPVNQSLAMPLSGNPNLTDFNRWQPLSLSVFIDQSGNVFPNNTPPFLSPEWGQVTPFALSPNDLIINQRNGFDYYVYHDPGTPPEIDINTGFNSTDYKWGFALVSLWSSHLDANDPTLLDISPASLGNIQNYPDPNSIIEMQGFYDIINGGDASVGHTMNPITGQPYTSQMVKRADYARVLAEFWADGPDSETPPGHWFTLLNYVSDHPDFEKRFEGNSAILSDLEWDVKAYFAMGGAMHDAAVTAWGVKGWYDYIRPVSAIRGMAELGQSSDPTRASYHVGGLPLITNYIELVEVGDPLAGSNNQNVGKIKLYAWKGPDYITNPATTAAGVDWILAADWFPYQRPTFVTPNFAGYVSGHSTFSRAAAEVMTAMTGDAYFPGGMGEFNADQNQFLVFEEGPSEDIVLQWATYRDASDQCSLSRIWGGIHPPADDIPGRLMGIEIGVDAFNLAKSYIYGFECPTNYEILNTTIPTVYYHAEEYIRSNGTIATGASVIFKAGDNVSLDGGFDIGVGCELDIDIEDCP